MSVSDHPELFFTDLVENPQAVVARAAQIGIRLPAAIFEELVEGSRASSRAAVVKKHSPNSNALKYRLNKTDELATGHGQPDFVRDFLAESAREEARHRDDYVVKGLLASGDLAPVTTSGNALDAVVDLDAELARRLAPSHRTVICSPERYAEMVKDPRFGQVAQALKIEFMRSATMDDSIFLVAEGGVSFSAGGHQIDYHDGLRQIRISDSIFGPLQHSPTSVVRAK